MKSSPVPPMAGNSPMAKKDQGMIFDIKHYAIHDGPGIRTTVFLKGCSLRCHWCANPESQLSGPELMFDDTLCRKCRACANICPNGAVEFIDNHRLFIRSRCLGCGQCVEACKFEALKMCGYLIDAHTLWEQVKDDRIFWDRSGGGVTLSGGEPLLQHEFAQQFLSLCREHHVHTAIETCGHVPESQFASVLSFADLIIFDFKLENSELHQESTGFHNTLIKNNLDHALKSNTNVLVRMPLIRDYNDMPEELKRLARFIEKRRPGVGFEMLPYHRLGEKKYERLGRQYKLENIEAVSPRELQMAKEGLKDFDIKLI